MGEFIADRRSDEKAYEDHRVLNFLSLMLIAGPILVAPVNFIAGKTVLGIVEILLPLFTALFIFLFRTFNKSKGQKILISIYIIFFALMPSYTNVHYNAYFLTVGSMIVLFVILGFKTGLRINIVIFILSIAGYIYRVNTRDDSITIGASANFFGVYAVLFLISAYNSYIKEKDQNTINSLVNELRNMTVIDELTQLGNRRAFDKRYEYEWNRHLRYNQNLSILMCDIDYFKKYNDSLGHQRGDECLKQVGKTLEGCVMRDTDFVARYGGEEFIIILPVTDEHNALIVADRIINRITELKIDHPTSDLGYLTISIGVVAIKPGDDNTRDKLVKAADDALYISKKIGRNRFTLGKL